MEFNDLLRMEGLVPSNVALALHKMSTRAARRVLCQMVEEDTDAFNAYQSTHPAIQEATLKSRAVLASFVMTDEGQFTFVGLFKNAGTVHFADADEQTHALFLRMREKVDGSVGAVVSGQADRLADLKHRLLFDLVEMEELSGLRGRLKISDPGARNYMRLADKTRLPVVEIARERRIMPPIPDRDELVLGAEEVRDLPRDWRIRLASWRGVYLILDRTDGARYVGAAYGSDNLFGRWAQHVAGERGIAKELAKRNPASFQFSILELLSPSAEAHDVIRRERRWMDRLATLTHGLNT